MTQENRFCVLHCGMPAHECDCYRGQMAKMFEDLMSKQVPLGRDFEAAITKNVEELYEP